MISNFEKLPKSSASNFDFINYELLLCPLIISTFPIISTLFWPHEKVLIMSEYSIKFVSLSSRTFNLDSKF